MCGGDPLSAFPAKDRHPPDGRLGDPPLRSPHASAAPTPGTEATRCFSAPPGTDRQHRVPCPAAGTGDGANTGRGRGIAATAIASAAPGGGLSPRTLRCKPNGHDQHRDTRHPGPGPRSPGQRNEDTWSRGHIWRRYPGQHANACHHSSSRHTGTKTGDTHPRAGDGGHVDRGAIAHGGIVSYALQRLRHRPGL